MGKQEAGDERIHAIVRDLLKDVTTDAWALRSDAGLAPGGIVVTTDTVTESGHRLAGASWDDLGFLGVAGALSDLAATGALPIGCLVSVVAPSGSVEAIAGALAGVREACHAHGTGVLGGDTKPGAELVLTVTCLGRASIHMTRAGARPGDVVCITGRAGAGFAAAKGSAPVRQGMRPRARLDEGARLAAAGATACSDTSDGVFGAAWAIADASGCGIDLRPDAVPLPPTVAAEDRLAALGYGGDYELVVTIPARQLEPILRTWRETAPLTRIGGVVAGSAVRLVGRSEAGPAPRGYGHVWS